MKMIQNTFLILYHNNSFFQLNRRNKDNTNHIILNLYLVFFNYAILLVSVIDLIEIYLELPRNYQSSMIFYLLL